MVVHGQAAVLQEEFDAARHNLHASLSMAQESGNRANLEALALLAAETSLLHQAAQLLGAVTMLRQMWNTPGTYASTILNRLKEQLLPNRSIIQQR